MNNSVKLGATLYDLRKKAGFSQEELADKLGVSRQAVSKWECGDSMPDTDKLITISKLYGVSLDELVGNTPEPATEEELAQDEVFVLGEGDAKKITRVLYAFPYPIFVTIVFLLWGMLSGGDGFAASWTLFITIPIYYSLVTCIKTKKLSPFAYPVFAAFFFFFVGMQWGGWHWTWLIFLTIPIYYSVAGAIDKK